MTLALEPIAADDFPTWSATLRERFTALLARGAPDRLTAQERDAALHRLLPREQGADRPIAFWVVRDGERVGHLWVSYDDRAWAVRDVLLAEPQDAHALRELIISRAREANSSALDAAWVTGEPSHATFVDDPAFEATATNMALPLVDLPPEPGVRLRPMTAQEYADWRAVEDEDYIATRIRNGEAPDVARSTAAEQHARLIPDGLETPGHSFSIAEVDGLRVGELWLDLRHPSAFVFNVAVEESARGQGHGRAIMHAAARLAHRVGATSMSLNVFGDNHIARRLYDSLGYRPTQGNVRMDL